MNKGLFTVSTGLALVLSASAWSTAHAQQQGQQQPQAQTQQQQPQQQQTQGQAVEPVEVEVIRPDQEQQQAGQQQGGEVDLVSWMQAQDEISAEGWSARWILDQPVYGLDGNEVGEVENLFIGPDGQISSLVVETGGFIGIGDVPIRLDRREVQFTDDARIVADIREDNLPEFELFTDEPQPEQRAFRVTELIGDYVSLEDEQAYGYVSDVVFSPAGEVSAIIVSPSYGFGARYGRPYGYYAYPYYGYGYGFTPGAGRYQLPYTAEEVGQMQPFDYGSIRREELAEAVGGGELGVEQRQQQQQQQPQ